MAVNNHLFLQALGPRRPDAVHAQRVNHGGAYITGHAAQGAEGHDDDRQGDMVQHVHEFFPAVGILDSGRLGAHDRENAPHHAEDVHENQGDNVNRNAVAQHRHHLGGAVKLFSFVNGAENTQRNRDSQRCDRGKDVDEDGVAHRGLDHVHNIPLVQIAVSEIAFQHPVECSVRILPKTHPAKISHHQRIVQTHLLAQLLIQHLIFVRLQGLPLRFQLLPGRVRRNQVVQGEHQKGEDQEYHDNEAAAFKNVSAHSAPSLRKKPDCSIAGNGSSLRVPVAQTAERLLPVSGPPSRKKGGGHRSVRPRKKSGLKPSLITPRRKHTEWPVQSSSRSSAHSPAASRGIQ